MIQLLLLLSFTFNIFTTQEKEIKEKLLNISTILDSVSDQAKATLQFFAGAMNKKYAKKPQTQEKIKDWIQWHFKQLKIIQENNRHIFTNQQIMHNAIIIIEFIKHLENSINSRKLDINNKFSINTFPLKKSATEISLKDADKTFLELNECNRKLNTINSKILVLNLSRLNIACRYIDNAFTTINQKYKLLVGAQYGLTATTCVAFLLYLTPVEFVKKDPILLKLKSLVGRADLGKKTKERLDGPKLLEYAASEIHKMDTNGSKQLLLGCGGAMAYLYGTNIGFDSITGFTNSISQFISTKWKKLQGFTPDLNPTENYETPTITLDNKKIILNKEQQEQLQAIAQCIANPEIYGEFTPKNIILVGDPGCGKTELARALCGSVQEIIDKNQGTRKFKFKEVQPGEILFSQDSLKQVIKEAEKNAPIILFLDEFHLMGTNKAENTPNGVWGSNILANLLTTISGINTKDDPKSQVILIAATNRHDLIDPALKRSGRFGDLVIHCNKPEFQDRKRFFAVKFQEYGIDENEVNLDNIAAQTKGCSFSDLADIIKHARSLAKLNSNSINQKYILQSIYEKVYNICKDNNLSEKTKHIIAAHLSGQTLIHNLLKLNGKIHLITINGIWKKLSEENTDLKNQISWGKIFIGDTQGNDLIATNTQIIAQVKFLLAGQIAQKILLNETSDYKLEDNINAYNILEKLLLNGYDKTNLSKKQLEETKQKIFTLISQYEKEVEDLLNKNNNTLKSIFEKLLNSPNAMLTDEELNDILN